VERWRENPSLSYIVWTSRKALCKGNGTSECCDFSYKSMSYFKPHLSHVF
jgi:hypothetical protein